MTQTKGKIGVTTENIFPVIKKFLYSDHEIFLRELVANAVDATQKLKAIAGKGEFKGELGDTAIKIEADDKKHILRITDRGIGMTEEEIDRYINQIAFSSAGEFLEKYKDQLDSIIGHFGLGFYSAFMVSEKVEIESLSYKEGSKGVKWTCDGSPEFTMQETKRQDRGTTITLHLDSDSHEFATKQKVEQLLNKYCKFMPVQISFDGKTVNDCEPLWAKTPSEIKDDEYLNFYRKLYPMKEDPLFWIHLNVDYPFNLTGILYFPKIKDRMDVSKDRIQLYCNQMFVTDSVENIVPEFLTLLYGVIDSPDIPLNVSRSYLQADSNVKKISTYITKKVADRLEDISKEKKEEFETKWDNLKLFIEYGMLTDEKFCDRAMKFALLKTIDGSFFNYEDFGKLIEKEQKDKDKKVVYLYATDSTAQYQYIQAAKDKGYQVLLFDSQLDSHFVNLLETKIKDSRFSRVDSDTVDNLIRKEDSQKPQLKDGEELDLEHAFAAVLPEEGRYSLQAENMGENAAPLLITQNEFMRRYKEMSSLGGGLNFYGELPDSYTLKLNVENPLVKQILLQKDQATEEKVKDLSLQSANIQDALDLIEKDTKNKKDEDIPQELKDKRSKLNDSLSDLRNQRKNLMADFGKGNTLLKQITDLALLANGMLKGKQLSEFVSRSLALLK